jgi:hypothetical protein
LQAYDVTHARALRAPTTTRATEHTTMDPKIRTCLSEPALTAVGPSPGPVTGLVKRQTIGQLKNSMYRKELVRKWTILRVILREVGGLKDAQEEGIEAGLPEI